MVSICHSVARETRLRLLWSTSCFSIFRFISIFPRPFHARFHKLLFLDMLWWNLSLNSAVAPFRMDVRWILREFWSTFEPSWNSIHVSRRSRQKSHDCRRSPSCRHASGTPLICTYELSQFRFKRYNRLTIENLIRNSMYS